MTNIIGNLGVFDHKIHEWDVFHGRLTQFIKLNDFSATKQSAVLLTHLSDESYRLVRNLVHPDKLEEKSFSDLVKVLNLHFSPKRSTFADRAKFYEASKSDGESIEEWAARLRGLAVYCDFGSELDTLLRDRFVLGFKTGPERDRLFEQDSKKLTFAQALDVAQRAACARQARDVIVKEEPVFRMRDQHRGHPTRRVSEGGQSRCTVCGFKNHESAKCRYKNYKCSNCGQKGHLKKLCEAKKSNLHNIGAESDLCQENNCKECDLYNLRYVNYSPIKLTVSVNNVLLCMELDSGSGATVISKKLYDLHFYNCKLFEGDLKMCLYNGHKMTPFGYFLANITYLGRTEEIKCYVLENGGPPLLGRDFMTKFEIYFVTSNNNLNCENEPIEEVQRLLNLYPDVWKDELGCFNKFEVQLQLKNNVTPKFFKPRSVPFALKDKVSAEIDRLVKIGILEPVDYAEYATPIVPV